MPCFASRRGFSCPRAPAVSISMGRGRQYDEAGPKGQMQCLSGGVIRVGRRAGAKIMAEGTKEKPILLTSSQPAGQRTGGWWGGLLVLGAAPINTNRATGDNEATFEAFTSAIPEGKFGGTNAADSSGVLKYVRIEFAGFNFVADREFTLARRVTSPRTRFNAAVSPQRVVEGCRLPLAEVRQIRALAPGCKVNDVFLAIVGGALHAYLQRSGELPSQSLRRPSMPADLALRMDRLGVG